MTKDKNANTTYCYEGQNLICAVDIKTTGPTPYYNALIELNILPLDKDFNRTSIVPAFHIKIQPKRTDTRGTLRHKKAIDVLDYAQAYEVFHSWYASLNIRAKARIVPVVFSWADTKPFLDDFLGLDDDGNLYTDLYFKKHIYKDIHATLFYLKDLLNRKTFDGYSPIQIIHGNDTFTSCMTVLKLSPAPKSNYYHNCLNLSKLYKHLIEIISLQ